MKIVENVLDNVPAHTQCAFILPDKKLEKASKAQMKRILKNHRLRKVINRFRLFQTMYSVMSGLGTHHEDVASKEDALLLLRYVEDCLLWCFRKGVNC